MKTTTNPSDFIFLSKEQNEPHEGVRRHLSPVKIVSFVDAPSLQLFVIYDHPADYPDKFVIRRWNLNGPGNIMAFADTLDEARELLPGGLSNLKRNPNDDPKIVEVWV